MLKGLRVLFDAREGPSHFDIPDVTSLLNVSAMSESNVDLLCDLLQMWTIVLQDSPLRVTCGKKPRKAFVDFLVSISEAKIIDTIKFYSSLADELLKSSKLYGSGSHTGAWLDAMKKTPVFKEYHAFYKTGDPALLQYVLSFLVFGKKIKLDDPAWEEVALRDWLDIEERLPDQLQSCDARTMGIVRGFVALLTENFVLSPLLPKFGRGAVAERGVRTVDEKFLNLYHPPTVDRLLEIGGIPPEEHEAYLRFICLDADVGAVNASLTDSSYLSLFRLVPKDVTKSRSIVMEPDVLMSMQQSVLSDFVRCFETGLMRRYVDLSDQTLNQYAAYYGSYTGDVDTIDLSSASDSVAWCLIDALFPAHIKEVLSLTRSEYTKMPDGSTRRLKKFAPMGSALCFPTQCIVYTACALAAYVLRLEEVGRVQVQVSSPTLTRQLRFICDFNIASGFEYVRSECGVLQPLRVYGDDICTDSSCTQTLIDLLVSYGFKVNVAKSFVGSDAVRESCGKYYHNGHDITPIRFMLESGPNDAPKIASKIAFINRSGDMGYMALRRVLIHDVLYRHDGSLRPILFTESRTGPFFIFSERPVNRHLKNSGGMTRQPKGCHALDYQRYEVRCWNRTSKDRRLTQSELSDSYRYMRWFAGPHDLRDVIPTSCRVYASGSRVLAGWTPPA